MTASKPRPMPGAIPLRPCWPVPLVTAVGLCPMDCAVHRRGVRQQCVLDRRCRADCLLDCGAFYPGWGTCCRIETGGGRHAALYDTPRYQRFLPAADRVIAQMARGRWVVALFIVAILGMSVVKSSFSPPPIVRSAG